MGQDTGEITPETVLARNDAMLFSDVGDGTALMDIDRGEYFHYEQVGSRIWELIDGKGTVADICERLLAEYEIDRETCETQTNAFLSKLLELKHVTRA